MKSILHSFIVVSGLLTIFAMPLPALAQMDHDHSHDGHGSANLSLDNGNKWQTDAPLRKGMQNINDAAMKAVPAFHDDKLATADAEKLAKLINDQVAFMVANCKLEPKADATLHVLIGDLLMGADTLSKQPSSMQGLPKIIKALSIYPDYFNHPGWVLEHP